MNGRTHPLGVVVETRGLGWNFPAGNQDIIYFIYTFYNVSSVDPADYATSGPPLRDRAAAAGRRRSRPPTRRPFGIDIPDGGYTHQQRVRGLRADLDVTADAGANYATFNMLFAWDHLRREVQRRAGQRPSIPASHAPPFLPGPGFVGTKYLRSPILAGRRRSRAPCSFGPHDQPRRASGPEQRHSSSTATSPAT